MENAMTRANMGVMSANEETKEIAEIQAKMILARNFPRNIEQCREAVKSECLSKRLAETAIYEFPRGDSVVQGPSIRLVECVARNYGNIISGVKEVGTSTDGKKATVRSYAWDLQSNFCDEKVFEVEYIRHTKKGSYPLTDPRDRYEMLANQGARRKRACIQAVIPQYIIDEAMVLCRETLERSIKAEAETSNIEEIRGKMLSAFIALDETVTEGELGKVVGKDFTAITVNDIVKLRNLYNAVKEGFVKLSVALKREEKPDVPDVDESKLNKINDILGA